jgi:hypothetical protein
VVKRLLEIPGAFYFHPLVKQSYFWILILSTFLIFSCRKHGKKSEFSQHRKGYTYRLLAFETKGLENHQGDIAHLNLEFLTQSDSVFWDSYNNFGDQFYIRADSGSSDFISVHVAGSSVGDSVELLLSPREFFNQRFQSGVPKECLTDTVVKIKFRVLSFLDAGTTHLLSPDTHTEAKRIAEYFGSEKKAVEALDPAGFYWIGKKADAQKVNHEGERIRLLYKGSFLNGRSIDRGFQEMDLVIGTPDQVLPGLNNVIQRLKVGENAKIILPSRLAFGEQGSSDGQVPAGMPLIYEVTIKSK